MFVNRHVQQNRISFRYNMQGHMCTCAQTHYVHVKSFDLRSIIPNTKLYDHWGQIVCWKVLHSWWTKSRAFTQSNQDDAWIICGAWEHWRLWVLYIILFLSNPFPWCLPEFVLDNPLPWCLRDWSYGIHCWKLIQHRSPQDDENQEYPIKKWKSN